MLKSEAVGLPYLLAWVANTGCGLCRFGKDTKVVHFLGLVKPWHHIYDKSTGGLKQIFSEQGWFRCFITVCIYL